MALMTILALLGDGESPLVIYQSSMLACHESLASLSSLCLCVNDDVSDHDDDHDLTILVIMIIITQSYSPEIFLPLLQKFSDR